MHRHTQARAHKHTPTHTHAHAHARATAANLLQGVHGGCLAAGAGNEKRGLSIAVLAAHLVAKADSGIPPGVIAAPPLSPVLPPPPRPLLRRLGST